jgi:hypothetical protein
VCYSFGSPMVLGSLPSFLLKIIRTYIMCVFRQLLIVSSSKSWEKVGNAAYFITCQVFGIEFTYLYWILVEILGFVLVTFTIDIPFKININCFLQFVLLYFRKSCERLQKEQKLFFLMS